MGRFILAFRTKHYDFTALAEDGQLIATTLSLVLAGLSAAFAKDKNVTGAGTQAKAIDSEGQVTNVVGTVVGQQSTTPPQVR